jgi:hypothetical protein
MINLGKGCPSVKVEGARDGVLRRVETELEPEPGLSGSTGFLAIYEDGLGRIFPVGGLSDSI